MDNGGPNGEVHIAEDPKASMSRTPEREEEASPETEWMVAAAVLDR